MLPKISEECRKASEIVASAARQLDEAADIINDLLDTGGHPPDVVRKAHDLLSRMGVERRVKITCFPLIPT